ncbi:hypothetical protein D3C71_2051320 [compost metagenome]
MASAVFGLMPNQNGVVLSDAPVEVVTVITRSRMTTGAVGVPLIWPEVVLNVSP